MSITTSLSSTSFHSTMIKNATKTSVIADDYDYSGAAIYTAGILIFYSTGLVLMLFFHVRSRRFRDQFIFDYEETNGSSTSLNNPFRHYHHFQINDMNGEILNELKDPKRREYLWKIYYSSREKQNEPHPQYYQTIATDSATIDLINKKLATIQRTTIMDDMNASSMTSLNVPSNNATKTLSKSLNSMRRLGGVLTKLPIIQVHSEAELLRAMPPKEAHSDINETQAKVISNSNPHGSTNKRSNRFAVEKVSDNHRGCSDGRR